MDLNYKLNLRINLNLNKIAKPRGFFDKIYNHSREGGIDPFGNVTTNTP